MKNIHVLPTDKPSRLLYNSTTKKLDLYKITVYSSQCQNIYITNSEEIKQGDWFFDIISNTIHKAELATGVFNSRKKIILTTDQDLIKDGVQAIDDKFLEWFVKNPSCEEVEVEEHEIHTWEYSKILYKIIIPKEEPKKETLEEVAEIWVNNRFTKQIKDEDIYASKNSIIESHILFSKWQMERSYSEEDMKLAIMFGVNGMYGFQIGEEGYIDNQIKKFLEQFKKK